MQRLRSLTAGRHRPPVASSAALEGEVSAGSSRGSLPALTSL
jgi:hypothetical protein